MATMMDAMNVTQTTRAKNEFDHGAIHVQAAVRLGDGVLGANVSDLSGARGTEGIFFVSGAIGCDLMKVGSRFIVKPQTVDVSEHVQRGAGHSRGLRGG